MNALKRIAIGATLACSAVVSFAQPVDDAPIPLVLIPTGPLTQEVTFDRAVNGLFLDTFTFTPSSFSGLVSVSLLPVSGPINFFAALLNGEGFSFLPEDGPATFSFQAMVNANVPLELQVFGYSGDASTLTDAAGVYRGTVVAAIPEPETYALMLAGLALVGALGRRRLRRAVT